MIYEVTLEMEPPPEGVGKVFLLHRGFGRPNENLGTAKMSNLRVLVLSIMLSAATTAAQQPRAIAACPVTESAQVSISFNGVEAEAPNLKGRLDSKIDEIRKLAKEVGIESVTVQSTSYSVNSQGYGNPTASQYQYSGSVSLVVRPIQKSEEFFILLTKKGHQASLNVSRYQNDGNCIDRDV